jgi:hypothetical protein
MELSVPFGQTKEIQGDLLCQRVFSVNVGVSVHCLSFV